MAEMTDAQRLFRFVERAKRITKKAYFSDGRRVYTFRINPQTYSNESEALQGDVQTLDGYGVLDFGVKPSHITMQGFTGIDGVDGPGGLWALEYFRPMVGRPTKKIMFGYPAHFNGVKHGYLRRMTDRITADKHLYAQYDLAFVEYGADTPAPAVRVPAPQLAITPYPR